MGAPSLSVLEIVNGAGELMCAHWAEGCMIRSLTRAMLAQRSAPG